MAVGKKYKGLLCWGKKVVGEGSGEGKGYKAASCYTHAIVASGKEGTHTHSVVGLGDEELGTLD